MPDPSPTSLCRGRYTLLEILGEGGMSVVWRARDEQLAVERALKVLAASAARGSETLARFENEARAMAALAHPGFVAIYDLRCDDGPPFIVMELLPGGTLWDWVRAHGPMPARMAVELLIAVADAVQVAHAAGIVHRDLKPQNVLIDAGSRPRVSDFGIARLLEGEVEREWTRTGMVLGTWAYMAPEQRRCAREVDTRADVYSLGATLCALLTGTAPWDLFAAGDDVTLIEGVPAPLVGLVLQATRYRPEARFPDAAAFAQALRERLPELDPVPAGTPALGGASQAASRRQACEQATSASGSSSNSAGPAAQLLYRRRPVLEEETDAAAGRLTRGWIAAGILAPSAAALAALALVGTQHAPEQQRWAGEVLDLLLQAELRVEGDARQVLVRDPEGALHEPGRLPPRDYVVWVRFAEQDALEPLDALRLERGQRLVLRCDAGARRCEVVGGR